jgi:L-seryl-tRNA(Ser) seleniumtransferase
MRAVSGSMSQDLLKQLPAVDKWLASEQSAVLCAEYSRAEVVDVMREHLARVRAAVKSGIAELPPFESPEYFVLLRADLLARRRASFRRVINATGIVIHTNLGRAPLAEEALRAIDHAARGYSNLEYDLAEGRRGARSAHVSDLIARLTGAEAAFVVNNCAGAVVLVLRALAQEREVIVSRGELIEIGGSFRMPDVIAESGAQMVEVGTTNRTTLADYAGAISERTRVFLVSHPSNYRIVGFTAKPALADLSRLARERQVLLFEDLGSGSLIDLTGVLAASEPTVGASLAQGVDVVTFSGDKLLGGPQAGVIAGRADLVATIERHPLARALRIDKLSLAALDATLRLYLPPHDPRERVPVLRMLAQSAGEIESRAAAFTKQLADIAELEMALVDGESYAGGGALPMNGIPTKLIRMTVRDVAAHEFARRLRDSDPPLIVRIVADAVTLDLRTVGPQEAAEAAAVIRGAVT